MAADRFIPNLIDYAVQYGQVTYDEHPLTELDRLLFCRLPCLLWGDILSADFGCALTLEQAADIFLARLDPNKRLRGGLFMERQDVELLTSSAHLPRFAALRLSGYHRNIDHDEATQFAGLTIRLPDESTFIAFSGTDDSLAGWKEDFMMSFLPVIPAQREAVRYLESAADALPGSLALCGHSKGGNLSIFSAAFCRGAVQRRIDEIYNFDGPGFIDTVFKTDGYRAIHGRIRSFIPQSSLIGLLLDHEDVYTVVRSQVIAPLQHDVYSWVVEGDRLERLDSLTRQSRHADAAVREWIAGVELPQRRLFINTLFDILGSTQATTLAELSADWQTNARHMLENIKQLDKATRNVLRQVLRELTRSLFSLDLARRLREQEAEAEE